MSGYVWWVSALTRSPATNRCSRRVKKKRPISVILGPISYLKTLHVSVQTTLVIQCSVSCTPSKGQAPQRATVEDYPATATHSRCPCTACKQSKAGKMVAGATGHGSLRCREPRHKRWMESRHQRWMESRHQRWMETIRVISPCDPETHLAHAVQRGTCRATWHVPCKKDNERIVTAQNDKECIMTNLVCALGTLP